MLVLTARRGGGVFKEIMNRVSFSEVCDIRTFLGHQIPFWNLRSGNQRNISLIMQIIQMKIILMENYTNLEFRKYYEWNPYKHYYGITIIIIIIIGIYKMQPILIKQDIQ